MTDENKNLNVDGKDKTTVEMPEIPADAKEDSTPTAEEVKAAAVDEMEQASQKALAAMREDNNTRNEEVVDEAEQKIDDVYDSFRTWLNSNTSPDKLKEELEKVRVETARILNKTRENVIDVASSEQFKTTMQSGKDFLAGTGAMIGDGFKYGYDKLMEVPEFKKMAGKVDEGVDKLRHSDTLRTIVENSEKGLDDLNHAIFGGLKSFFDSSAKDDEKKDE